MYVKDQLSEQVSNCFVLGGQQIFIQSRIKNYSDFIFSVYIQILQCGWYILSQSLVIVAGHKFFFGGKQFIALDQKLANVLCKGLDTKYLGVLQTIWCLSQLFTFASCNTKAAIGSVYMNRMWLCFTQILFTQKDSWIWYMGHSLLSPTLNATVDLQFKYQSLL